MRNVIYPEVNNKTKKSSHSVVECLHDLTRIVVVSFEHLGVCLSVPIYVYLNYFDVGAQSKPFFLQFYLRESHGLLLNVLWTPRM